MPDAVAIKAFAALSVDEREAWAHIARTEPAFASAFFTPAFAAALDAARADLQVAVVRCAGAPSAFLGFHRERFGVARPLAGALSDMHGIVTAHGQRVHAREIIQAARMRAFVFDHLGYDQARHGFTGRRGEGDHVIDLSGGFGAYMEARRALKPGPFRTLRSRRKKLEKALGGLTFTFDDRASGTLDEAIAMKSAHYASTGAFDVFSRSWVRAFMRALHDTRCEDCALIVSTLRDPAGALAAVHIGVRSRRALHYWFPAYAPALAAFSPGLVLLHDLAQAFAGEGGQMINLGKGEYRYKREFASYQVPMLVGVLTTPGLSRAAQSAANAVVRVADRLKPGFEVGLAARAYRRLDRVLAYTAYP